MDERSKSSVVVAIYQPRFSSPSRQFVGTRTFSKKTSLKPWLFIMSMSGRVLMPGVFMSTRKYEMPLCFGASKSVRAMRIIQSA